MARVSRQVHSSSEVEIVENTHTAGWWPQIYQPLRQLGEKVADWFAPRSGASAVQDCYEISIELPGVKREDIDVATHDNHLTIKGEKKVEREEQGRSFFFSEREYGAFQRTFRLPADIEPASISANFVDGVPKAGPPTEARRQIKVKAA